MKPILDYLINRFEHAKGQPHHIRKQIAFGVSSGIAALIAIVWLVSSVESGTFALKNPTPEDGSGDGSMFVAGMGGGSQNLAGAAAALTNESAPAHIEIIDTTPAPVKVKPVEQTTVPF
ncbi:MAG: hypothetical protein NT108_00525 [Candidatus Kaiserbacteria bacterium]|nr:hypothetical protein [Candidatus Kaiserbacteria bacterium]